MENHAVLYAFLLTLLAGGATGVGSALAYFTRRTRKGVLGFALGFSGGVMIFISFVELYSQAEKALVPAYGDFAGRVATALGFFGGMALAAAIDFFVPSYENPHEGGTVEDIEPSAAKSAEDRQLHRMGVLAALAIGVHNFPEGVATFFSGLGDHTVAVSIAVAIALHNIPEGVAVSIPVYYATGSRKKAFWYSTLSGVAEPAGAVVGYLVLRPFFTPAVMGFVFAAVAGIMVFISLDQLVPNARKYSDGHQSVYGLVGGMAVMAATLLMF